MRLLPIAIPGLLLAGSALAEPLPDGTYRGETDGVLMVLRVSARAMSIEIEADGCLGAVDGRFQDAGPGAWRLTAPTVPGESCEIRIARQGKGMAVSEGAGCSFFHGASCSFDGAVR